MYRIVAVYHITLKCVTIQNISAVKNLYLSTDCKITKMFIVFLNIKAKDECVTASIKSITIPFTLKYLLRLESSHFPGHDKWMSL